MKNLFRQFHPLTDLIVAMDMTGMQPWFVLLSLPGNIVELEHMHHSVILSLVHRMSISPLPSQPMITSCRLFWPTD